MVSEMIENGDAAAGGDHKRHTCYIPDRCFHHGRGAESYEPEARRVYFEVSHKRRSFDISGQEAVVKELHYMERKRTDLFIMALITMSCIGVSIESILLGWEFWVPPGLMW